MTQHFSDHPGARPGKENPPPIAAAARYDEPGKEEAALRQWASVAIMLNNLVGMTGADGVKVSEINLKVSADGTGFMWTFKGVRKKSKLIAWNYGKHAAAAFHQMVQRVSTGRCKWREDTPWAERTQGSEEDDVPLADEPRL